MHSISDALAPCIFMRWGHHELAAYDTRSIQLDNAPTVTS